MTQPWGRLAPTLLLLLSLCAPPAAAHAIFSSSDPAPDSQNAVGIARVTVTLSEDVVLDFSDLEVTTLQNDDRTAGAVRHGARANVLEIDTVPLEDGVYVVAWKALSVDTHTTRGQFLFAVGNATLTFRSGSQTQETQAPGGNTPDAIGRAVFYAGLLLALGVPAFFLAVDRATPPRAALLTTAIAAALGAAGALVNLYLLAKRADAGMLAVALSRGGAPLAWRALLLALGGAILAFAPPRRATLAVAATLAVGALVATSLGSHAASVTERQLATVANDALHILMAAAWVGGVVGLLFAAAGRNAPDVARLIARFSPLAMGSVLVVLATGVYASFVFVREPAALWTTTYGRLVLVKSALLVVLAGFGAVHQRFLGPRLLRAAATPRTFRRVLAIEAAVMLLVVGAAGALATTSPPKDEVAIDPTPLVFLLDETTEKTHVFVQISPNPVRVGIQTMHVLVHPLDGKALPNGTLVQVRLWHENDTQPEDNIQPERTGPDQWTLRGGYFTSEGTWRLDVLVQRPDEGFRKFSFEVPVSPAEGGPS